MDIKQQTENVAAQGRFGDSMLLHVNPAEVKGLASAMPITTNPETGQPEAFLPFLAPLLGSMLAPSAFAALGVGSGLSAAAMSGIGAGLATYAQTGGSGSKALLSGLTAGMGTKALNTGAEAAIGADAAIQPGIDAAILPGATDLSVQAAQQTARDTAIQAAQEGSKLGFNAGNFRGFTPGEALSNTFSGGFDSGAQALATGMMSPSGVAAGVGAGTQGIIASQEEFERQMIQMGLDEEERKKRMYERYPEQIPMAEGGRTGYRRGGDFGNNNYSRFGFGDFENSYDNFSNMFDGGGPGGGGGYGGGGGGGYNYGGGYGPSRVRRTRPINPGFMAGFGPEQRYFQGDNPDTYLTQYATDIQGSNPYATPNSGMGGMFGGRERRGGMGGIFGGRRRGYNPQLTPPPPQFGGYGNPFMQTPSYRSFYGNPQMGGMINPYAAFRQAPIQPYTPPPPSETPPPGDTPPPDQPPIDGPPDGPPPDGPPIDAPPPYEVPGMGNFKGNPVVTPPGATPPATGTPPTGGTPPTVTPPATGTPPTAGGPPPGTGRPPPDYYEDDDFFDRPGQGRPGQGRPPMPPSIGRPGGGVPGGTPGFYDPPSGGKPPQYGGPPMQYPGGTPGFYEGPEPIDTTMPITRPPEITIPIEGGADVTIPGFTMPGFGGKPIGGGFTLPISGGSDYMPKPPQIGGPVNDGPGSGGMEDPNPIFKPPGRPGQQPISIGGPGGGITSIGQPLDGSDPGLPKLPGGPNQLKPIELNDFGFGAGIRPSEIITPDGQFIGSGGVTPPDSGNILYRGGSKDFDFTGGQGLTKLPVNDPGKPLGPGDPPDLSNIVGGPAMFRPKDLIPSMGYDPNENPVPFDPSNMRQGNANSQLGPLGNMPLAGTMGGPGSGNLGTASTLRGLEFSNSIGRKPNESVEDYKIRFANEIKPVLDKQEQERILSGQQQFASGSKEALSRSLGQEPIRPPAPIPVGNAMAPFMPRVIDDGRQLPPGVGPQPIPPATIGNPIQQLQPINSQPGSGIKQPMPMPIQGGRPPAPILGGNDFLPQPPGDLRPVQPPQVGGGFMPQPAPPSVQPVPSIGFTPPSPTPNQGTFANQPKPPMSGGIFGAPMFAEGGDTDLPNEGLKALAQTEKGKEAVEAMGYQEGGQTDMMQDPITQEAIMFILGETDNENAINMFVERYGSEAFMQLRDMILKQAAGNPNAQTEGLIQGNGNSGMADDLPGVIGNKEQIAVSQDEFIVPADVVSMLGDGSSDAGSKQLYNMMDRVRQAKTGGTTQAPRINPNKVMPA